MPFTGRGREFSRLDVTGARGFHWRPTWPASSAVILDPLVIDVANVDIPVHAAVTFTKSDKDANTPYRMTATLVGHDPVGEFAEVPGDDVIANGSLTPDGGKIIRADGVDRQEFDFPRKTLALEDLNEDRSDNPDEIKAHVTLTPIVATATEAESNIRTLTA